jgi:hypothetical protein
MTESMKTWIRAFDGEINKMTDVKPHYTANRVSVEFKEAKIYNIQYQAKNKFRIHFTCSTPFDKTDKQYRAGWFKKQNIYVDDQTQ